MSTRIPLTIEGNLTAAPKFGISASTNKPWANFDVAVNSRRYNDEAKEWEDGETIFHKVSAFGKLASNIQTSLKKGDPVVVVGELEFRDYTDREGNIRESRQVIATVVGPSLKLTTAATGTSLEEASPKASGPDATATGPVTTSTPDRTVEVAF
jgi:single-strand DNA-binding protein